MDFRSFCIKIIEFQPVGKQYQWDEASTYIHNPPFFQTMGLEPEAIVDIKEAYCLLNVPLV